ncbi:MAG: hypothetical protein ABI175_07020 [Polyangiales bacterium]
MTRPLRAPFVRVVTFAALASGAACDDGALFRLAPDTGGDAPDLDAATGEVLVVPAARPTGEPPLHARPLEKTVGKACTNDEECSPGNSGTNFCSNDGSFAYGTLYPTPVCLGRSCDRVAGEAITRCDGGHGICVENTTLASVCLPACTFDGTGAPPRGCVGHDACIALGVEEGRGVGYCLGGCTRDEDCTLGDVCQRDVGFCVRQLFERTMDFGIACTAGTNPPEVECNCLFPAPVSGLGYCTQFCLVGDARTTCPAGHRCSARVPATLGDEPAGIGGNCLRTCETDDECAPINAYCDHTLAGGAVCVPGERPPP